MFPGGFRWVSMCYRLFRQGLFPDLDRATILQQELRRVFRRLTLALLIWPRFLMWFHRSMNEPIHLKDAFRVVHETCG